LTSKIKNEAIIQENKNGFFKKRKKMKLHRLEEKKSLLEEAIQKKIFC